MDFVATGDFGTAYPHVCCTLKEALSQSIRPENGQMLMPRNIPVLPRAYFANLADMNLREIAFVVLRQFMDSDIPSGDLNKIVQRVYRHEIPLKPVPDKPGLWIEELYHGPTLSFKDYGAAMLGELLDYFGRGEMRTVLIATTGNAGMASALALKNIPGLRTVVLYPRNALPRMYQRILGGMGDNVMPVEVAGSIADCRQLVRSALIDTDAVNRYGLSAANSINIARVLAQIPFFFHGWAQVSQGNIALPVDFYIPTGNMSNLCAAVISRRMGLPVNALHACGNSHDIPGKILRGQVYSATGDMTYAPALTVSRPTNLPRLMALGWSKDNIYTHTVGDSDIADVVRRSRQQVSPHTATAMFPAYHSTDNAQRVVLATEHPSKSLNIMTAITGEPVELPFQMMSLNSGVGRRTIHMAPTLPALYKLLS